MASSNDDNVPSQLCTFAATGPHAALQAIFVRQTCSTSGDAKEEVCICQACAETCHADHDGLEYIGFGPSYCDCNRGCCKLKQVSKAAAEKLGIPPEGLFCHAVTPPRDDSEEVFFQQVYHIPALDNSEASERLIRQATELVKHTKDTHWISVAHMKRTDLCELEQLARSVFRQHVKQNELPVNDGKSGAEWWVQVKTITQPDSDASRLDSPADAQEAVDLHYDKDEDLAETFGLGSFPTLSTVTYLTCSKNAAPTLVFPRTYDQSDDDVMNQMLLSHARRGKHLVFDGRLLHGAPSHYALRPLSSADHNDDDNDEHIRVTFLVNIWPLRPVGVQILSTKIRHAVMQAAGKSLLGDSNPWADAEFQRRCVEIMDLKDENDLPDCIRGRIELPFVSKGATWLEDDDEEEGGGLVLVTFPPPTHQSDTVRVRFGPGLQAYLDYVQTANREDVVHEQATDPEEVCYV